MKITLQKTVKTEIDLPEFFKLAQYLWYYAIVDEKTMLHVKSAAWGYPLIEQVDASIHANVIARHEIIEVTEQEFKDKFNEAYLRLSELSN
jgi:hypothetical protein